MAAAAVRRQLTAMHVCMTGRAVLRQPQIGSGFDGIRFRGNVLCLDVRGIVAFLAFLFGMFPFERESCLLMIELAWIPSNQNKSASVMVFMTRSAFDVPCGVVVPVAREYPRADLDMAIEALIAKGLVTEVVTFGAIRHAFEFCMCPGQFTGGHQLGERSERQRHSEEHAQKDKRECGFHHVIGGVHAGQDQNSQRYPSETVTTTWTMRITNMMIENG